MASEKSTLAINIVDEPVTPEIEQGDIEEETKPEPPSAKTNPPVKKISLEITNPGDIDIDDKGQLGLF
jgi:topoisomerase-4 subunit A